MNDTTLQEKYFTYKGRLNRKPFIIRSLKLIIANFLVVFVIGFIAFFIGLVSDADGSLETLGSILSLPFVIAAVMLTIRRWHDMNRSGWWYLLTFIPIINLVAFLILCCIKGTEGANDFGADPLKQW